MANEKRLIDADALMRRLRKRREDFASGWRTLDAMPTNAQIQYHENLECALIVEDIPFVDAVEVVRCKDCKHYDNSEGICWCKINSKFFPGGVDWHGFPEDGFCSYGERKDNENTV